MARAFSSECYSTNARRISGILSGIYDAKLEGTGINIAQYSLLVNLDRMESGNLTEWAEASGIERTTMVRNAQKLAEEGLIEETKGRGKVYKLSGKGKKVLTKSVPIWEETQKEIAGLIGKKDAEALIRIGKKIQAL